MLPYNKKLKYRARELRKNMTWAERVLWSRIRRKQIKNRQFNRQRIIGNYIVDFYCSKAKLVIEIDGEKHYTSAEIVYDKRRDAYLKGLNLKVMRFSYYEVLHNVDGVLSVIEHYL